MKDQSLDLLIIFEIFSEIIIYKLINIITEKPIIIELIRKIGIIRTGALITAFFKEYTKSKGLKYSIVLVSRVSHSSFFFNHC